MGGGGGGLYPRRPITGCVLCLQVNGPVTEGSYKWEEGGIYPGGLITQCNVLFTGKWTCNWGNL